MIDLTNQTSLKLPFSAKNCVVLQSDNVKTLQNLSQQIQNYASFLILGNGTNLVAKTKFDGLVIKINLLGKKIIAETDNDFFISASAGENWHDFIIWCIENSAFGLENLSHIPGQVGSTPIQNVGAYGVEVSQFIDKIFVWNLATQQQQVFENSQCDFAYRHSIFKNSNAKNLLISKIIFKLPKAKVWKANLDYVDLKNYFQNLVENLPNVAITPMQIVNALKIIRNRKIPDFHKFPNAGSFFQNPTILAENLIKLQQKISEKIAFKWIDKSQQFARISAAWLIENVGFKGKQIGNFSMSAQQPLILINHDGKGDRTELENFIKILQNEIFNKFGIELKPEPIFL